MERSPQEQFRLRTGYVACALLVAFVGVAVRLAYIQAYQHPMWAATAERMEADCVTIEAPRGLILDRNGRTLAATTHVPSLYVNPRAVPAERRSEVAATLAQILKTDPNHITEILSRPKYFVRVQRQVTPEQVQAVQRADLPGVTFLDEPTRCYPNGAFASQLLGFVNLDGVGSAGIEQSQNALLSGAPGSALVHRDGLGRTIVVAQRSSALDLVSLDDANSGMIRPAVNGRSLILTIDSRIQQIVEEELRTACEKYKPESACAIVLDPWTGDVLAMACWPTFDPAHLGAAPRQVWQNMAVCEMLEPGSSFKPLVCSLALQDGCVTPDTVFDCHQGAWHIGARTLHDAHGYGRLSVRDIIAFSSNIGMAQVGMRAGAERVYRGLCAFGIGRKTGIELPAESSGQLHPLRQWTSLSISSIPMGQEVAVSPLQLTAAFCAFANGGWWVKPRIILGVADDEGRKLLKPAAPPVFRRAIKEQTAKLMCTDLLFQVVEKGTARGCRIDWPFSGKTGTAQIALPGARGYEAGAYTSVFVGIVPSNAPKFVISVIMKKPSLAHYGGVVSGPAVAHMAERTLSMLKVPRETDDDEDAKPVVRTTARRGH